MSHCIGYQPRDIFQEIETSLEYGRAISAVFITGSYQHRSDITIGITSESAPPPAVIVLIDPFFTIDTLRAFGSGIHLEVFLHFLVIIIYR